MSNSDRGHCGVSYKSEGRPIFPHQKISDDAIHSPILYVSGGARGAAILDLQLSIISGGMCADRRRSVWIP